jgi:hypothetical protein
MTSLAELKSEVARLNAKIAELEGKAPKLAPKPVPEERPLISYAVLSSNFVRPTENELRRLADIVLARFPRLGPRKTLRGWLSDEYETAFREGFAWSFQRLGFIGRTAEPDKKYYVEHWMHDAKDWLVRYRPNHYGDIAGSFLCACVAHGDVAHIVGDQSRGIVWSVGLTAHGGKLPTGVGWKRVLDTGTLLPPTEVQSVRDGSIGAVREVARTW